MQGSCMWSSFIQCSPQVHRIHLAPSFLENLAELGSLIDFPPPHITSSDVVRWYCVSKHMSVKSLSLTKSPVWERAFYFPPGDDFCSVSRSMKYWNGRKKHVLADPTTAFILYETALIQLCSFKLYLLIFPDTYFIILKSSIIWTLLKPLEMNNTSILWLRNQEVKYMRENTEAAKRTEQNTFFFIEIYKASI